MVGRYDRLRRAKEVVANYTSDSDRRWLLAVVQSYGDERYITRLHVMEGTPPRAYILENAERGICTIIGMNGDLIGTVRGGEVAGTPIRFNPAKRRRT